MSGLIDFDLGSVGGLFTDIRRALTGKEIEDPQKVLEELTKFETNLHTAKSQIITAEAKSDNKLASSWRPMLMYVFMFIIANNYIIVPYAQTLFNVSIPSLAIPPEMWNLLTLGLTGYIASRGIEKTMQHYKGKS